MAAMGKQVVDAGGVMVEILAAKAGLAVTKADLMAWIDTYQLPVTTVRDPDAMPTQSITALVRREYTFIVDLKTMKIVNRYIGSTDGSGISSAMTGMQTMLSLLGPKGG
jgi:hypothetical protein